ncbi:MAG: hypothetical protein AAFP00_17875, partial [Bacteroidota bacterium]
LHLLCQLCKGDQKLKLKDRSDLSGFCLISASILHKSKTEKVWTESFTDGAIVPSLTAPSSLQTIH